MAINNRMDLKQKLTSAEQEIKKHFMEMLDIPASKTEHVKKSQNYRDFLNHLFADAFVDDAAAEEVLDADE